MPIIKGSGQGSGGKGLLVTALTEGTAQTLHTAVAGIGTPQLFRMIASNPTNTPVTITVVLVPSDASDNVTFTETVGAQQEKNLFAELGAIPLNETMVVKVYASVASVAYVWGIVSDQATTPQTQQILSGEITAVQNDDAFRTNGVASSNVEADHQVLIPVDGYLTNLRGEALAAVGGGATCTMTVRVDGADTALSTTFANADGTTLKSDTDQVAVSAGSLVTINVATDNVGAPAATLQASVDFVPSA